MDYRTLLENNTSQEVERNIAISITHNRIFPNIKSIIEKYWHDLQINPEFKEILQLTPQIAFHKNNHDEIV